MKELSLHILDIAMNSIRADADILEITIDENTDKDLLSIKITDNGCGMDSEMLKTVTDPFISSRTTRKVGLGISLFKANAENCNGNFSIESKLNLGTVVKARFQLSHIDRPVLGNIASVISMLFSSHPDINIYFGYKKENKYYSIKTQEIKDELNGISIQNPEVKFLIEEIIESELNNMDIKS